VTAPSATAVSRRDTQLLVRIISRLVMSRMSRVKILAQKSRRESWDVARV
jgi:hypothetical protein